MKTAEKRTKITPALRKCVDEYFSKVKSIITEKEVLNNFLGYAPVLEAISTHITEIPNTSKLLSELKENSDEVYLINNVMNNLLAREQDKLVSAFKEKLKEDAEKIANWEDIYSKNEQLGRLLNYVLFNSIDRSDSYNSIPDYLMDDYFEMLELFLPQHPFIQNSFKNAPEKVSDGTIEFAGPAFRDYCIAYSILNEDQEESAELYYQQEVSTSRFPSPLFWNHYTDISENTINSRHFSYVYEAYRSKTSIGSQTSLSVSQDEYDTCAVFRIIKGDDVIDETTLDVIINNDIFVFDNLNNTSVNVNCDVLIGQGENATIVDSNVFAKKIIFNASTLTVSAYHPNTTTLHSDEPTENMNHILKNITVNSSDNILIDFPNIYEYPKLSRFKHEFSYDCYDDIHTFIYYMRKIFSCFRTHKKDMPARDAEKIDFVIVAESQTKKDIFDFLVDCSIIFKDQHLYKINIQKMSSYGISWGGLNSSNTEQLQKAFEAFSEWRNSK